jgi:hypothetical protein
MTFLPLVLLVILDIVLIMWHLNIKFSKKNKGQSLHQRSARQVKPIVRSAAELVNGEQAREKERSRPDPEDSFESRIASVRRQDTGFLSGFADPEGLEASVKQVSRES